MNIAAALQNQYHAGLEMLHQTIAQCPESLWLDESYKNRFWHIVYHTLFYTHLYLFDTEADFVPWQKYRKLYHFMGPIPWPPHNEPEIDEPYSQADVLEYLEFCRQKIDGVLPSLDLDADSGFDWLPFNKFELQLYNIRHIQHHTGQLVDRLRVKEGIRIDWIGVP